MAINPGIKDFEVVRRNDFPLTLTIKDGYGAKINFKYKDGYPPTINHERETKFADFSITFTNRPNGTVDIKLTDTQTSTFSPHELKYDFQLIEPDGDKFPYLTGTLYIKEGFSA